jgi:hypothetical protein
LLNNFTGTIDLSSTVGTGFNAAADQPPNEGTISVGPSELPQGGKNSAYSATTLAIALAHELGHALLPNGYINASAASQAAAIQTGLTDEGTADAAEFVVAAQLGIQAGVVAGQPLETFIVQSTGFSATLVNQLYTAVGGATGAAQLSSLSALEGSSYLTVATPDGAAYMTSARPSEAGPYPSPSQMKSNPSLEFTYTNYYGDKGSTSVNWTQMTTGSIVLNGSSFTGANIPLLANTALTVGLNTQRVGAVSNEKLSFSGASAQNPPGVVTLATPTSATVVGGLGTNDVMNGLPGTDTFEVDLSQAELNNPAGNTVTIIANASGQSSVSLFDGVSSLPGSSSAPLQVEPKVGPLEQWSTNGQPGGFQYTFSSTLDTMTISNVSANGLGNNVIVIDNFNLAAAESSTGFLGIYLNPPAYLNATANAGVDPPALNFTEGSNQSYTLSVDAPSATAQTFTVTLSGAIPSDFEATVGDTIEQLNSNGTFNVTLAAGETNVSFGLTDVTADNGSSDIASGATLQLAASLPNPDTLVGGSIQTAPLTFSYIPGGEDTAPAPHPSNVILGTYDSVTGITTYLGDGGDDYITGTGSANLINANNSGNDSIVGGSDTNTIEGGAGNSVVMLSGTSDLVELGTGFNTVYDVYPGRLRTGNLSN